MLLYNKK